MNNNIMVWAVPLVITLLLAFGNIFVVKVRVDYIAKRYEKIILDINELQNRQKIILDYCCSEIDKKSNNDCSK